MITLTDLENFLDTNVSLEKDESIKIYFSNNLDEIEVYVIKKPEIGKEDEDIDLLFLYDFEKSIGYEGEKIFDYLSKESVVEVEAMLRNVSIMRKRAC